MRNCNARGIDYVKDLRNTAKAIREVRRNRINDGNQEGLCNNLCDKFRENFVNYNVYLWDHASNFDKSWQKFFGRFQREYPDVIALCIDAKTMEDVVFESSDVLQDEY